MAIRGATWDSEFAQPQSAKIREHLSDNLFTYKMDATIGANSKSMMSLRDPSPDGTGRKQFQTII